MRSSGRSKTLAGPSRNVATRHQLASEKGLAAEPAGSHELSCGPHHEHPSVPMPGSEELERAAALFRALGDTSRLALILRLDGGGQCVGELAEATGAKLSTLSQQLRVLHAERLVTRRREGKHIRYALADEHVRALARAAIDHAEELSPRKKGNPR